MSELGIFRANSIINYASCLFYYASLIFKLEFFTYMKLFVLEIQASTDKGLDRKYVIRGSI